MTATERVYRAACHAYPRSYRARCESEIISTALAASDDRRSIPREVIGLVVGGARRRQLDAGSRGARGVVSAGLALAALVVIGAFAATVASPSRSRRSSPSFPSSCSRSGTPRPACPDG